jgi:putative DNA primase/helicase
MEIAMYDICAEQIALALGGRKSGPRWMAPCPAHQDRTPSLSLIDAGGGLVLWHCHAGCSQRDVRDALVARELWPRPGDAGEPVRCGNPRPAFKPARPDQANRVPRLWREAVDPRGTLAEQYLNGRGLALDDDLAMRVLRFHGHCPFGKDENGKTFHVPALIVAFRPSRNDDESAPPPAIHRIGLNPDGSKLGKMMLGPVGGCAIKLDADDMAEQGLGVGEGFETCMRVRAKGWRPIWALGSAGAIKSFTPIPGIETLSIFADHDANGVGPAAAKHCAQVWQAAGCEVFIRTPRDVGADWLDVQP